MISALIKFEEKISPRAKALMVCAFFFLAGVAAWHYLPTTDMVSNDIALPLFIFYLTIVINTFFSIELFTRIIPKENITQKVFDAALVITYLGMACAMKNVLLFVFIDTLLFIIAAGKYAALLRKVHHPILLKRKIIIDLTGALAGLLAIGGVVLGYPLETAWTLAIVKVLANIGLLYFWPMYRLDNEL